jgi:hypothetical protein
MTQNIRLEADLVIPDGRELYVPIYIPPVALAINASAPAKIQSVRSLHTDGLFGVGEIIDIDIQFTSPVDVTGAPRLQLRTGCHNSLCTIREVQSFECSATSGIFKCCNRPK